jgi:dynein heavy chain, axonemal
MIYFVDDLNLPEVDPYNTQSAIALMRQHMDYGHWYDIQKLQMKQVADCQYIAAMNPTAGSFQVNPRLQRHFSTFAVGMPSATSLLTIFQTFLDGHLNNNNFEPTIAQISPNLIKAALATHKEVSETFRKTAANFHYEFSIRHLSNVFQGMLMSQAPNFIHPEKLVVLWLHETERVYGDRMVSQEDIDKFKALLMTQGKKAFPQYNVQRFYVAGNSNPEPLIFCHFADGLDDDSGYNMVLQVDRLQAILDNALAEYNETNAMMDLILFEDAIFHVLKITRIIKQNAGHALLVGVGGSGKQSLSRLAAFICGFTVTQLTITQTYAITDLKTDLQGMYYKAGVKGEGVVFLLNDSQISNERFLVYINDLLGSARIADLYSKDEQENIVNTVVNKVKAKGLATDPTTCWNYFIGMVRQNLHCILCVSPVGVELRSRTRKFPAIVNCTVIDWFQPWPKNALTKVAKKFLSGLELGDIKVRTGIENFMPFSFETVSMQSHKFKLMEGRHVHTTPKSYLELLKLYGALLNKKRKEVDDGISRLANGVDKLKSSAEAVALLEKNLHKMLEEAEEKQKLSEQIALQVASEKEKVQAETEKANVEADKVGEIQQDVAKKQADAEADLAKAEPAVQAAMAALDTLDKKDLGTCKTMAKPPPGVNDIFGAVVVLMAGVNPNVVVQKNGKVKDKDRSWDAAKKALLGNINGFVDELATFKGKIDDGSVPDVNFKEIRPYFNLEHFNVETIEKRNSSAAGLCSWVLNIVSYYDIVLVVEPKRQLLREATKQLETANRQLEVVRAKVAELQAKLDQLTADYEAADQEMKDARHQAETGKLKLELAARLIKALGSENVRWSEGIAALQAEKDVLVGDVLLASAFISYIAPFTKPFREELVREMWIPFIYKAATGNQPIPMTSNLDPLRILANEAEIAAWNNQGLPADPVSSQNGAIVNCTARWPLLIDPQLQGVAWVKNKESNKSRNLQITRLDQPDYLRKLELSIENGWSVLIENMGEKIDPILMPVISRAAVKKGSKRFLKLGSMEVEYHPDFKLFLHTKLSNPHYPPEIQAETTLVNFTVTPQGLEDQLLALVVRKERSDLANKHAALIQQRNIFKVKIKQLEDDILMRLSSAEGDITEDRALIEGLERAKMLSDEIKIKLEQGIRTAESITRVSEKYRSVARRTSLLFFVMYDLNKIHTYYVYSLFSFVVFFSNGMERAGKKSGGGGAAGGGGGTPKKRGPQRPTAKGGAAESQETKFSWDPNILKPFAPTSEAELVRIIESETSAGNDLTDEEIQKRCGELKESITSTIFNYIREGLFERDRLTVSAMLAFQILQVRKGTHRQRVPLCDSYVLDRDACLCARCRTKARWSPLWWRACS